MRMMRIIVLCILFSVALNALFAGYSFMSDPSGGGLHISLSRLAHSPFTNYFIPGLVLFTAVGILSLLTSIAIIVNWKYYSLAVMIQGLILSGWIVIQVVFLRDIHILHLIMGGIGIVLIVSGFILNKKMK